MRRVNVCLIDDDPIQIFLMRKYLEKTNVTNQIVDFSNGKIAFDFFSNCLETEINLIFLDINMPVWDGWEFLKEFSKLSLYQKCKIFILTSSQSPFDKEQASKYKLDQCYISKPISYETIHKILFSHLDNY